MEANRAHCRCIYPIQRSQGKTRYISKRGLKRYLMICCSRAFSKKVFRLGICHIKCATGGLAWGIGVTLAIYLTLGDGGGSVGHVPVGTDDFRTDRRMQCGTSGRCFGSRLYRVHCELDHLPRGPINPSWAEPSKGPWPRLVTWLMGWGDAAFPDDVGGFFYVYASPFTRRCGRSILFRSRGGTSHETAF